MANKIVFSDELLTLCAPYLSLYKDYSWHQKSASKPSTQDQWGLEENQGEPTKWWMWRTPTFHLAPSLLNTRPDKSVYFLLGETIVLSVIDNVICNYVTHSKGFIFKIMDV